MRRRLVLLCRVGYVSGALRRFVPVVVCAAAVACFAAPAAQAASITPLPVTGLTPTSGTLNASISTSGLATNWEFQFGGTTAYGVNSPVTTIPVGVTSPQIVSFHVSALRPGVTYHYRVVITVAIPGVYGLFPADSGDLTFTTPEGGFLALTAPRLRVKHGIVSVGLVCASSFPCAGEVVAIGKSRGKTFECFSDFATLKPGAVVFHLRLTHACYTALRTGYGRGIAGTLVWSTTTGQGTFRRNILILKH